jgi:hypothetical protein
MTTIFIPWLPESLKLTHEWLTDILPGADGTETRTCLRSNPEVTVDLEYNMVGDDIAAQALRETRSNLVNDPGARLRVPLRHEAVFLEDTTNEGDAVLVLDYDRSADWARAGVTVYVEDDENEDGYTAVVVGDPVHVGDTLEVTVNVVAPEDLSPSSYRVCPTVLLQPKNLQTLGLFRVEQGEWSVTGTAQEFLFGHGTGIALPDNADGYLVWDRAAVQEGSRLVAEEFDAGLDLLGAPLTEGGTLYPKALVRRDLSFSIADIDDWRWYKEFLFSVRGRQVPFLRPTFRHDLTLLSQPASPTSVLIVDEDPDYRPWLVGADTYRRLALTMSDGSVQAVDVDDVDDNMDGTHTVNLTDPFARGALTISKVSFLEATRLASDAVVMVALRGKLAALNVQTLAGDWLGV